MSAPIWLALDNISVCYSENHVRAALRNKGQCRVIEIWESYSDDPRLMETEPEYWYKQCTMCVLIMIQWMHPESAQDFVLNGNQLDIKLEATHMDSPITWHFTAGDPDLFREIHGEKNIHGFNYGMFTRRQLEKYDMDVTDELNWTHDLNEDEAKDDEENDPCYKYDVRDIDEQRADWLHARDSESTLADPYKEEEEYEDYYDD